MAFLILSVLEESNHDVNRLQSLLIRTLIY